MSHSEKTRRPKNLRLAGELGFFQTLPGGDDAFTVHGSGSRLLLIGLGPDPQSLSFVAGAQTVSYMECEPILAHVAPPPGWERVFSLPAWLAKAGHDVRIALYRPGLRAFPGFYGPLAALAGLTLQGGPQPRSQTILLPGDDNSLLVPELRWELEQLGYTVVSAPRRPDAAFVADFLRNETPALFLSVNFHGLDPFGEVFQYLRIAGVPIAVWCVDNPWHLLSGLRSSFWKQCVLFVTDPAFIAGLKAAGAQRVSALPLAGSPRFFQESAQPWPHPLKPVVFVGRSAFPDKERFFSGLALKTDERRHIEALLLEGQRPDYLYWLTQTGVAANRSALSAPSLWPGREARRPGFFAEESSCLWRRLCIRHAAPLGISVFGDAGFADITPPGDLHASVDYYAKAPSLYAAARYSLGLTSLLLPHGLNQRHFDVWLAGGFLVSDNTPGLALFPEHLAKEIRFSRPADIPVLVNRLEKEMRLRADLQTAWKDEILSRHTYAARIGVLLETCGL